MRYQCTLNRLADGRWQARHRSQELGSLRVAASTRDEAVAKILGEIRYRLELCPCSGESYRHVPIEIVDESTD